MVVAARVDFAATKVCICNCRILGAATDERRSDPLEIRSVIAPICNLGPVITASCNRYSGVKISYYSSAESVGAKHWDQYIW